MTIEEGFKLGLNSEQVAHINSLEDSGYIVDMNKSVASASFVFSKGEDFYVFRAKCETLHNPEALLSIKV